MFGGFPVRDKSFTNLTSQERLSCENLTVSNQATINRLRINNIQTQSISANDITATTITSNDLTSQTIYADDMNLQNLTTNTIVTDDLTVNDNLNTPSININNNLLLTTSNSSISTKMILPTILPTSINQVLGIDSINNSTSPETTTLKWVNQSTHTTPQILSVSKAAVVAGSNYNLLTDAIAYINTQSPGPANRWTVNVLAGIYEEPDTVVIPSFVTIYGDFTLAAVITTLGSSHVIKVSNRCDIYNLTIQGPTNSGMAGIFAEDIDIGGFIGNCRIAFCDIGILLRPLTNLTVFCYVRMCLFNSNVTQAVKIDGFTNTGTTVNSFFWNNVYYSPSVGLNSLTDTSTPLLKFSGAGVFHRCFAGVYERDEANPLGIALWVDEGAKVVLNTSVLDWFATGIYVPSDSSSPDVIINSPTFMCTTNIEIVNVNTTGFLFGESEFEQIVSPYTSSWFISNQNKQTLTVSQSGSSNFKDISSALNYITNSLPTPSSSNRFLIQLDVGQYLFVNTLTVPDFVDISGASSTQTIIYTTVTNMDLMHVGYNCQLSNFALWGSNYTANLNTATGSVAYGVKYVGTSSRSSSSIYQVFFHNIYNPVALIQNPGTISDLQITFCQCFGYVNTEYFIKIVASSASVVGITSCIHAPLFVFGLSSVYQGFLSMTGTSNSVSNTCFMNTCVLQNAGTNLGTSIKNGVGANFNQGQLVVSNSLFNQCTTGISIPNAATTPNITLIGTKFTDCTNSINIQNPATTGSLILNCDLTSVICVSPNLAIVLTDNSGLGTVIGGPLLQSVTSKIDSTKQPQNITPQINQGSTTGLLSGGVLTNIVVSGSHYASCTAGTGYLMTGTFPDDTLNYIEFKTQDLLLSANTLSFLSIDNTGTMVLSLSESDNVTSIGLGSILTGIDGSSLYIISTLHTVPHLSTNIIQSMHATFGTVISSGCITYTSNNVSVGVTSGSYYVGSIEFDLQTIAPGTSFTGFYLASGGLYNYTQVSNLTTIPTQYNNSGVLTNIPVGQFAKHTFYVVASENNTLSLAFLVYGEELFASVNLANAGNDPATPSFFTESVLLTAAIVVTDSTDPTPISNVIDLRPVFITRTSTSISTNNHSNLINLQADDHKQYLLVDGTRNMSGNLGMGVFNIVTSGLVDGVVVHDHHSRHIPNSGADPLPVDVPVTISALSNSLGVAPSFALSDHLHAHGTQTDPTLHALATGIANGFMSTTQFTLLNNAAVIDTPNTLVLRNGSGASQFNGILLGGALNNTLVTLATNVLTTPYTLTFPLTSGTNLYVLTTDGSATTSWTEVVRSVATGTGLSGGPITSTGVISISDTAVTPGTYNFSTITVDQQGRLTSASTGTPVTSVATGTGLSGGVITSTGTISLADTAVTPGTYNFSTITVVQQGRLTSASTGTPVTSVATGTGLSGGVITSTGTISLADTAVTPGTYNFSTITVDQQGRLTSASTGTPVTSVATGTGLSGGVITSTGTISLANTTVTPGTYTDSTITVDQQGRLTSASSGINSTNFSTGLFVADDFLFANLAANSTTNSLLGGDTNWWQTLTSGNSISPTTTTSNETGVVQLATTNAANSFITWSKPSQTFKVGNGVTTMEWRVKITTAPTNATEALFLGFSTTTATTQAGAQNLSNNAPGSITTPCIMIRAERTVTNANWELVTGNGSATVNQSTTQNFAWAINTWVRLTLVINAGGTSVSLFVNGSLSQTNTSRIPVTTLFPIMGCVRGAATGVVCLFDYFTMNIVFTVAR